uniref:Uncharacterized protein n=1 Tax=Meloidogyne javanica TaxID=6303 RepID=A0A915M5A5_MELJA
MTNVLSNRTRKAATTLNALLAQSMPILPEQQDNMSELAEIKSTLVVLRGHLEELDDVMAAMDKIDEEWASVLSQATEIDKVRASRIYDKDQEDYQCEVILTKALEARRGLMRLIGNIRYWREFIESFNATIGNSNIEPIYKFNHLLGLLEGEALNLIRYFRPSADNYKIALNMLKEKYDDKEAITDDLIKRFLALKPCWSFSDVRQFQLEMELICRQLEALGAELNNPIICSSLEDKLNYSMLKEIKEAKRNNPAWNTKMFRDKLKQLVQEEESYKMAYGLQHEAKNTTKDGDA